MSILPHFLLFEETKKGSPSWIYSFSYLNYTVSSPPIRNQDSSARKFDLQRRDKDENVALTSARFLAMNYKPPQFGSSQRLQVKAIWFNSVNRYHV